MTKKPSLRIFLLIPILTLLPLLIQASSVGKSLRMIRAGEYEKARLSLEVAYNEAENDIGLNYALALYFFMEDHSGFDVFKANKYMVKCHEGYESISEKERKKYNKLGIRTYTIHSLANRINNYAYELADSLNNLETWEKYAAEFTISPFLAEAKERRNEMAFEMAQNQDSYKSFQDFMQKYPNASQIQYAKDLYEKSLFEQETAGGSYRDYKAFMEKYPESPYVEEAQKKYDLTLYKTVTASGTLEAYVDYINNYSDSPYAEEAQDKVYILSITEGSVEKYSDFVRNFLNNKNVNLVWQLLYEDYNFMKDTETYLSFQREFPNFPFKEQLANDIKISKRELEVFENEAGLYGYRNKGDKSVVVPPKFVDAYEFSEGMAAISSSECKDICNYGYIDKTGEVAIPEIYAEAGTFKDGRALVSIGNCEDIPCKWGYIDRKGVHVVPIIYDDVYPFSEAMALVGIDDKGYGFVNIGGKEVIELIYEDATPFSEGLAPVSLDGKWGFINAEGQYKIFPEFLQAGSFSEGIAPVKEKNSGLWGYINKKGNFVIPPKYKFAKSFVKQHALVMVDIESNGMKIMTEKKIDRSGKIIN